MMTHQIYFHSFSTTVKPCATRALRSERGQQANTRDCIKVRCPSFLAASLVLSFPLLLPSRPLAILSLLSRLSFSTMSADEVAKAFVQHFYGSYASNPAQLAGLYVRGCCLPSLRPLRTQGSVVLCLCHSY